MLRFNKTIAFLVVSCMLLVTFGCNVKSKNIGKMQTVTPSVTVTPSGVITTPQGTTVTPGGIIRSKPAVPAILRTFENNTLLLIKYLDSTKWKSADKKIATLTNEHKVLAPILQKEGVTSAVMNGISVNLNALAENAKGKKAYDSKLNANEILRYVGDARGSFISTFPLDLSRLDFYLRDIQYSAEKKDFTKAVDDLNFISPIWKSVTALMSTSDKNIAKMNTSIKAIQTEIKAKNVKKIVRESVKALDISSSIKKMFEKKGKSI